MTQIADLSSSCPWIPGWGQSSRTPIPDDTYSYITRPGVTTNKYKVAQHHYDFDLRKYNFTISVIPILNSLSDHNSFIDENCNTFKRCLDKFWSVSLQSTVTW